MNGVQTRFKCKLDVKRCKRFVFPPSSLLPRSNALKTKAIRYFQTDRTLTRIVSPPLFDAQLEYISPKGVEENGANQFEIKAAITVPDSITIRSGYSANAEIVLARASKVLAVPESTVEFKNDSTFVYVLTDSVPSQKFSRRAVITGMSDGIQIEIKNGLNVNEKVRGAEKK